MTLVSHRVRREHRRCERHKDERGRATTDTATCRQVLRQPSYHTSSHELSTSSDATKLSYILSWTVDKFWRNQVIIHPLMNCRQVLRQQSHHTFSHELSTSSEATKSSYILSWTMCLGTTIFQLSNCLLYCTVKCRSISQQPVYHNHARPHRFCCSIECRSNKVLVFCTTRTEEGGYRLFLRWSWWNNSVVSFQSAFCSFQSWSPVNKHTVVGTPVSTLWFSATNV